MISRVSKQFNNLLYKSTRNYYKLMREVNANEAPITLYSADKFSGTNLLHTLQAGLEKTLDTQSFVNAVYNDKYIHERYLRLVPFFLESLTYHKKQYVIRLGLLEKAESLRVTYLTNSGIFNKQVSLNNLVPTPFSDFLAANKRKTTEMPLFIDPDMIYYNSFEEEFYLFDREGQWHKEGVDHPLLDAAVRYNERRWHDDLRIH